MKIGRLGAVEALEDPFGDVLAELRQAGAMVSRHDMDLETAAGDGFPADFFRRGVGEEVDTFDDGVGFEEAERAAGFSVSGIDDGAVIAGPDSEGIAAGEAAEDAGDQGVFAEVVETF